MKKYSLLFYLFILLLGFFLNGRVYSEDKKVAILYTSPRARKGISVLAPNAIPNYFALYRIGKEEFKVVYTEYPIVVPGDWKKRYCENVVLFVVANKTEYKDETYSLFYRERRAGYSLFFIFKSKPDFVCGFVSQFIKEFKFFMQFRRYKTDIPFPAVVELGG